MADKLLLFTLKYFISIGLLNNGFLLLTEYNNNNNNNNNNNDNNNNNNHNNNNVRVFSRDIGMDFGIEKCATMVMKRGKLDKPEGIRLPDGRIIRGIGDDDEGYKYLGVLEADDIMHDEVKRSMKKEYIRRVKKTLSSKLNAGNVIKAINSWAVSLLRYSGGIVNWTKSEVAELDR